MLWAGDSKLAKMARPGCVTRHFAKTDDVTAEALQSTAHAHPEGPELVSRYFVQDAYRASDCKAPGAGVSLPRPPGTPKARPAAAPLPHHGDSPASLGQTGPARLQLQPLHFQTASSPILPTQQLLGTEEKPCACISSGPPTSDTASWQSEWRHTGKRTCLQDQEK
uniref:Uncharacterized protein n=1 Tax=Rangifer tarandus platyrhynchus TaxID=3082113 RepID=A0ACB0DY79_RANTA|nr:unnamed protein product [Rangifer tarandus platyrhynchus]